jgi:hypothetical protein
VNRFVVFDAMHGYLPTLRAGARIMVVAFCDLNMRAKTRCPQSDRGAQILLNDKALCQDAEFNKRECQRFVRSSESV